MLSCESRSEYISVQKQRYRGADRQYRTRLIDEVCEVCGYERKYAKKKKEKGVTPFLRHTPELNLA